MKAQIFFGTFFASIVVAGWLIMLALEGQGMGPNVYSRLSYSHYSIGSSDSGAPHAHGGDDRENSHGVP